MATVKKNLPSPPPPVEPAPVRKVIQNGLISHLKKKNPFYTMPFQLCKDFCENCKEKAHKKPNGKHCMHLEDVCENCLEKVHKTTEDEKTRDKFKQYEHERFLEKVNKIIEYKKTRDKSKQSEDENCPEKVNTTTEEAPPEKTITPREKRNSILIYSAILPILGYGAYLNTKFFFKILDSSAFILYDLLETIGTRTREE